MRHRWLTDGHELISEVSVKNPCFISVKNNILNYKKFMLNNKSSTTFLGIKLLNYLFTPLIKVVMDKYKTINILQKFNKVNF